ncbi:MAG TPA: galactokinase family protein [Gemmatimonadaceae bacterium]|nr:galactokinase family protein [Gemmatimonadaceae bacterium]
MTTTAALLSAGMSHDAARAKAELFARARTALAPVASSAHPLALFVPGRVELLGKHTDYAGGRSLLAAVERGICLLASPRADLMMRVIDARAGEEAVFAIDPALEPAVGLWSNYPMTVARRVARNFPELSRGADIAFASDLPPAAGMSSSSALMVAVFLALSDLNSLEQTPEWRGAIRSREELAAYLGCVENGQSFGPLSGDRGVGTFGGSEDHVAMLCCEAGTVSQYAFRPVRRERVVTFPEDHILVIATSGVVAEKTGAAREKYNRAALESRAIIDAWNAATAEGASSLGDVVARGPDAARRLAAILTKPALRDRLAQFVDENETIVPGATAALAGGDYAALGALVDRSQQNAERVLGNQVPETIHLARTARTLGAVAASAFGAGFGGSVWALVPRAAAERFAREWSSAYLAAYPARRGRAEVFLTRPGPPASRLA